MDTLGDDVLRLIFDNMDGGYLRVVGIICKRWRDARRGLSKEIKAKTVKRTSVMATICDVMLRDDQCVTDLLFALQHPNVFLRQNYQGHRDAYSMCMRKVVPRFQASGIRTNGLCVAVMPKGDDLFSIEIWGQKFPYKNTHDANALQLEIWGQKFPYENTHDANALQLAMRVAAAAAGTDYIFGERGHIVISKADHTLLQIVSNKFFDIHVVGFNGEFGPEYGALVELTYVTSFGCKYTIHGSMHLSDRMPFCNMCSKSEVLSSTT